jgi:hypothetical protein
MSPDPAWATVFMHNSFMRPGDLKALQHWHVETVRAKNTALWLILP